jgi:hypothetical protein
LKQKKKFEKKKPSMPTAIYNTAVYVSDPNDVSFQRDLDVGLTETDPNIGNYDYEFFGKLDLNDILTDFIYYRNNEEDPDTQQTVGELAAWGKLHDVLHNTGVDEPSTKFPNAAISTDVTWRTFWVGLVSQSIRPTDQEGISVNISEVVSSLADETDKNDQILGGINTSFGGVFGLGVPVPLDTIPSAVNAYFAALHSFLLFTYRHTDNTIKRVDGNPADAAGSKLRLLENDSINLRIECKVGANPIVTGLITLVQKTPAAPI